MTMLAGNKECSVNKQLMMNNTKKKTTLKSNTTHNESIQKITILDSNSGNDSTMDRQDSTNDHRITNVVGTTRSILQQIGLGTSTYLDSVSFKSSDLKSQKFWPFAKNIHTGNAQIRKTTQCRP